MKDFTGQIDNLVDSFNSSETKGGIENHALKLVSEIEAEMSSLYKTEDRKKYPLKYYLSDQAVLIGETKRISASNYAEKLLSGIGDTKPNSFSNESMLLDKFENFLELKDIDSASAMLETIEIGINNIELHRNKTFNNKFQELRKKYLSITGSDTSGLKNNLEILKTRRAESEYLIEAVEKNTEAVVLPRVFVEMKAKIDASKDGDLQRKFLGLTEFVNDSLAFLTKKGVNAKL